MRIAVRMLNAALATLLSASTGAARAVEPSPASASGLSYSQVSTFARMVGAPETDVSARLASDVQLSSMVLRALDAREARRRSTKNRAIAGFVILGVGSAVGGIIIATTPVNSDGTVSNDSQVVLGLGVAAAATAVGLAIAIPALATGGRMGPEELEATAAYRQRPVPVPVTAPPPQTSGRSAVVPLLALTF